MRFRHLTLVVALATMAGCTDGDAAPGGTGSDTDATGGVLFPDAGTTPRDAAQSTATTTAGADTAAVGDTDTGQDTDAGQDTASATDTFAAPGDAAQGDAGGGCARDARRCDQAGTVETCTEGAWVPAQTSCPAQGMACVAGQCVSPCQDAKTKSNSGCDYWAVDLDNAQVEDDGGPFAIIVSNQSALVARVAVTTYDGVGGAPTEVASAQVLPGALTVIDLPQRDMSVTGIHWAAFRVQSTAPIIAYQFNPLDNVDVFSNDASLLLPTDALGTDYVAVSHRELTFLSLGGQLRSHGWVSVVATVPNTTVTVTPTVRTSAGAGVSAIAGGATRSFTVSPYQVLNLRSDQDDGDLTGSLITASHPVAVFSGHDAATSADVCCADHLEQQLFPVATWSSEVVAAKSAARGVERDYWRVMAATDGTVVTTLPAVQAPVTLDRGGFVEIATDQDFVIQATHPVMVAQILASSSEIVAPPRGTACSDDAECAGGYACELSNDFSLRCLPPRCVQDGALCEASGHVCACESFSCRCQPVGDPALTLFPPTDQYRSDYNFLVPAEFAQNFITIIAPAGTAVALDGGAVSAGSFTPIAGTPWTVARLPITAGAHTLVSNPHPVGVISYGYDKDVSYGFPAGSNLTDL